MELLITAPVRIDFCLNNSETVYKTKKFYNLWKKLDNINYISKGIDEINYYKKEVNQNFVDSYDNSNKTNLEIFGLVVLNNSKKALQKLYEDGFIKKYFADILKSEIKIYDNTIGILDLKIKLNNIPKDKNSNFTEECEIKVKKLIYLIFKEITPSTDEYFDFIRKNDTDKILQSKNTNSEYNDYLDFYREKKNLQIMWASCALKYEENDNNLELLDHWLKGAIQEKEIVNIKNNSLGYSLDWLKYVFREDVENADDLWDTMFLAQYYYSVIEVIVYNLKLIINESFTINKKFSFSDLFKKNKIITVNDNIESISASAYIHITEYKDIKKYLKREELVIFNNILNAWTFDDILENTESLLSTAKDRVEIIYSKISSKNNFYTDILLTSIGFFAIIDLVLSFSQYSREYTADAMISSRGEDGTSFLYTLANIPIDMFIGSGFVISIVLLLVYFIYRKRILP